MTYAATNDGGTNTVVLTNPAGSTNMTWTNIVLANPGMVENWGEDWHGESDRPVWLTNAAAIAAGYTQSVAATDAGSGGAMGRVLYQIENQFLLRYQLFHRQPAAHQWRDRYRGRHGTGPGLDEQQHGLFMRG